MSRARHVIRFRSSVYVSDALFRESSDDEPIILSASKKLVVYKERSVRYFLWTRLLRLLTRAENVTARLRYRFGPSAEDPWEVQ